MSAIQVTVQHKGIYHGLPVFPESLKGLTAIVTGANGISGDYMLRVLNEAPERWSKIYALSRRPPYVSHKFTVPVEHLAMDFLNSSPEELAKQLKEKHVKADYVFFFSYVQVKPVPGEALWSDAERMASVNKSLLVNFLDALKIASIKPKRIMLQTGAKNYGIHLGAVNVPQVEDAPRVELEPNFYYPQEDVLWEYCKTNGIGWNVCMPSYILGAVREAAMNVVYPVGVFAAVQSYLKKPMIYPGDIRSWTLLQDQSSSMMNAYLEEWAVLTEEARNQKFNAVDSSWFSWGRFWPMLAGWYGVDWTPPDEDAQYTEISPRHKIPPRGFGSNPPVRYTNTLTLWAGQSEVQNAWRQLTEKHGLTSNPFENPDDLDRIFQFADASISMTLGIAMSPAKANKLGWHGMVDSYESYREVLEEFVSLKMLPPIPN